MDKMFDIVQKIIEMLGDLLFIIWFLWITLTVAKLWKEKGN